MAPDVFSGGIDPPYNRAQFQEKLFTLTDEQLIDLGKYIRGIVKRHYLPWDEAWTMKLEDCVAEWRRRHPKKPTP